MNSYIFVNDVEIYKFKARDSEINAALLCLGDVSNNFSVDSMKKYQIIPTCLYFFSRF